MVTGNFERRHVRFHKVGGSRSIVVPKEWLDRHHIEDDADIVLTQDAILIERHIQPAPSIEDEPEFATFLNFLLADALSRPDEFVDPTELFARADAVLDGVDAD